MSVEKIRELPNPVKHVAMDGVFVCAALTSHYVIFNVATGTCQDLFPYEPETHPIITRISKVCTNHDVEIIVEKRTEYYSNIFL